MRRRTSQSQTAGLAVFSRNHKVHLEAAAAAGAADPERLVVLRSQKKWISAAKAVRAHGPTAIYFAVVDGGSTVEYEAELVEVEVNPASDSVTTQRLLQHVAETTKDEGLWNDQVRTLYAIRGCRRVATPYLLSELSKQAGGQPLSDGYIRNYALVRKRSPVAV
jgi:hypothetical protein